MTTPILILSPHESRDINGTITPQLSGGVSLISGQYGEAWNTGPTGLLTADVAPLNLESQLTLMLRIKRGLTSNGVYLGNWSGTGSQGSIRLWESESRFLGTAVGDDFYDEWRCDIEGTSEYVVVTAVFNGTSILMYEDGQIRTPYAWDTDNTIPINDLDIGQLPHLNSIEMYENTILESLLVFHSALSQDDVLRISNMNEPWTWDNAQYETPKPAIINPPRYMSSKYKAIPRLWRVTRDNEYIDDITPLLIRGRVSFDPDRTIKWAFEGEISADANLQPYKDFIAPHLRLEYEDGHVEESQFGVYTTAPLGQTISPTQRTISIKSFDLTWLLANETYDNGTTAFAGSNPVTVIRYRLEEAGFDRHIIPDYNGTLNKSVSWRPGTSRLQVINDLLNMIGYYTLFMTKDGYLASLPYVTDRDKSPSVTYDTTKSSRVVVLRTIERDTTPDRIANKVVVIGGASIESPIISTLLNDSPTSPTSTVNLGMTITKTVEGAQVADQTAADVMAQRLLDNASQEYHRLTLHTSHDVSIDPYDVYRLNIRDNKGNAVADGVWNSRGWSMGFTNDEQMEHEMSNIDDPAMEMEG